MISEYPGQVGEGGEKKGKKAGERRAQVDAVKL